MNQIWSISPNKVILIISVFTELLPVIFFLLFNIRTKDKSLRVIFCLLVLSHLLDLYGLYRTQHGRDTYVTFNINILLECLFLLWFFYLVLYNKYIRKAIFFVFAAFLIVWTYTFGKVGRQTFLDNFVIIENVTILLLALSYYFEQIVIENFTFLHIPQRFWIVSAYLVYVAGTFFLTLYLPSLSNDEGTKYYVLNYVFVIIRTILLTIAMFMKNENPQKQKFKSSESRLY